MFVEFKYKRKGERVGKLLTCSLFFLTFDHDLSINPKVCTNIGARDGFLIEANKKEKKREFIFICKE